VLRLFVRLDLFDAGQAEGMLQWPHSGFHVHDAVWVDQDDQEFARRLARYCARNPIALERLTYDAEAHQVTYRSDKPDGPTAGSETGDALEFLARVLSHIPDKGHVTTRYYGWYANRPRGRRRQDAERSAAPPPAGAGPGPVVIEPALPLPMPEARRRWAELLRRIFEVDPLCGGAMRVIAVVAAPDVITAILTHLRAESLPPTPRAPREDAWRARQPPWPAPPA